MDFKQDTSTIMNEIVLKKRADILRERLIKFTMKEHNEFLLEHGLEQSTQWNSLFPLNEVKLKDLVTLKESPKVHKKETVRDYIKKNKVKVDGLPEVNKVFEHNKLSLSKEMIHRLEVRKRLCSESEKEIKRRVQAAEDQARIKELIHLAEVIKSAFTTQGEKNILLEDMVGKVIDVEAGRIISKGYVILYQIDEAMKKIMVLTKIVPNWIKVVAGSNRTYIKLNKNEGWNTILDSINKC